MATSVYDNPAELRLIDTYAPINFDQLYRAAKTQTDAIDRSINELSTNVANWASFRSPSQADTQAYYDSTIGHVRGYIDELASNPDLLKSAQGRYGLTSRINSIDFNRLSQLESSATALTQRQENIAKMQAQGLYNPNWDDIDISNYDTSQQGILTELTPVAYQGIYDLTSTIAKTPDQYIGHIDPYTYQVGVTEDMLRNSIRQGIGNIASNPAAQLTMRDIQMEYAARGIALTPEQIENEFVERAVQANYNNQVRANIQFDQVGMTRLKGAIDMARDNARQAAKTRGQQAEDNSFSSPSLQLRTHIQGVSNQQLSEHPIFSNLINTESQIDQDQSAVMSQLSEQMEPLIVAKQAADRDNNTELSNQIASQINNIRQQYYNTVNAADQLKAQASQITYQNGLRAELGIAPESDISKDTFESEDFVVAANRLMSTVSAPTPVENLNERLGSSYNSASAWDTVSGAQKQAFQPTSSKYVKLNQDIIYDQTGIPRDEIGYKEFIDQWNSGSIRNIQAIPTGEAYTYVDRYGQEKYYAASDVYVPYEDMKNFLDTSFARTTNSKAKDVFGATLVETSDSNGRNVRKYYKFRAQTELPVGGLSDQNYDRNISKQKGGTLESRNFRQGQTIMAFGEDL